MVSSRRLRASLALVGPSILLLSSLVVGCGARVVVDGAGGTIGAGGSGTGTGVGGGVVGGAGGAGCGLSAWTTGNQSHLPACFPPPAGSCPGQYDAPLYIFPSTPCVYLVSVDCGPVVVDGQCCYMVTEEPKPTCEG